MCGNGRNSGVLVMLTMASRRRARGFGLIELMVAMVIGLIVIGAVIALVLAMMRANNQTIQSTRLTQELRGTAAVISAELRRAGSVENPFDITGAAAAAVVDTSTAGCIRYRYVNATGTVLRTISTNNGAVFIGTDTCGSGQQISSNIVTFGTMTFTRTGRRIDFTLPGVLASDASVSRQYTESVFVSSLPGS